jgi:hypothetical protein
MCPAKNARSQFVRNLVLVEASMLCWALAVVGHPARWTLAGTAISFAYGCVLAAVLPRLSQRTGRAIGWVAAMAWVLMLAASLPELLGGSPTEWSVLVARRFLAWTWLVFPAVVAGSSAPSLRDKEPGLRLWLLGLAAAVTVAIAVGVPSDSGRFSVEATTAILVAAGLIAAPVILSLHLVSAAGQNADRLPDSRQVEP